MQNQGKIRCILLRQAKDKRQKTKDERQQTGFLGDGANDEMIFSTDANQQNFHSIH